MQVETKIQRPQSEQAISSMFDRIAPRYDFLNKLLSFRQDTRWRKHLVAMIPYRPSGFFVDVATGTGDVILAAAKAHSEYGRFVGVDISQEMLRLAKEKAGTTHDINAANFEFSKMSAERLEFADLSVDCMSIAFGLRNVVRRDLAITEFKRILKPGGTLLILEFFKPTFSIAAFGFRLYFNRILPLIGGLISDRSAYRYLPESVGGFASFVQLSSELVQNGFVVENSRAYLFGGCQLILARKLN